MASTTPLRIEAHAQPESSPTNSSPSPLPHNVSGTFTPSTAPKFCSGTPSAHTAPLCASITTQASGNPDYEIRYGASSPRGALAEVLQGTRVIDRADRVPYLAAFTLDRPLKLLDLGGFAGGTWPTRLGCDHSLDSGPTPEPRRRPARSTAPTLTSTAAHTAADSPVNCAWRNSNQQRTLFLPTRRPRCHCPISDPCAESIALQ